MGVQVLEPICKNDERGFSYETYSKKDFRLLGIDFKVANDIHFVYKKKNTLRGIHYQNEPMVQTKIVQCIRGKIIDYIVDLRNGSPTFLKWIKIELSEDNRLELIIPKGFGHAFITVEDNTEIVYKVDENYEPLLENSILWSDKDIGIDWECDKPLLSKKDEEAKPFAKCYCNFIYRK